MKECEWLLIRGECNEETYAADCGYVWLDYIYRRPLVDFKFKYCPGCGGKLILEDWMELEIKGLAGYRGLGPATYIYFTINGVREFGSFSGAVESRRATNNECPIFELKEILETKKVEK